MYNQQLSIVYLKTYTYAQSTIINKKINNLSGTQIISKNSYPINYEINKEIASSGTPMLYSWFFFQFHEVGQQTILCKRTQPNMAIGKEKQVICFLKPHSVLVMSKYLQSMYVELNIFFFQNLANLGEFFSRKSFVEVIDPLIVII